MEGSRPKNRIKKNKLRKPKKQLTGQLNRCPKPHRFVITDKKTNMQFLVAPDAEVSLFPKFIVSEKLQEVNQSCVLGNNSGSIIHTYGHITLKMDFGLGKPFSWQFTLVNLQKPVIGSDFLSHYRLKFNFEKMCLENPETGLETAKVPTVACECHRDEFCYDGWPSVTAIFKRSLKHRNHVTDKGSKIPFLIDCETEISIFPKSKLNGDTLEPFDGSFELHGLGNDGTQVLGWTSRKLDFGTGREFTWKFAVVNCEVPIIGLDFLHEFELDRQSKFGYLRLWDRKTNRPTSAPTGPCECGNRRSGWPISTVVKKSLISESENHQGAKSNLKGNFGSIHMKTQTSSQNSVSSRQNSKTFYQHPGLFRQNYQNSRFLHNYRPFRRYYKTRKPQTTKEVGFESKKATEENDKSAEGSNFSKTDESGVNHRLHVDDKNSNLPFLIGVAAEISVFPKSELKEEEDLEPFDGSFELKGPNREVVPILGWTTRILDIGLTRNFTWKFAVLDIEKPILGLDFILHYGLTVGTQGVVDPTTNLATPPPSGSCDCGKPYDGWPSMSYSKKKPISDKFKSKFQKDETGSTEKEFGTLNEESRKDSSTPEKESEGFRGSREPDKDSSPARNEGLEKKTDSSKEEVESLNKESRKYSPTSEKISVDLRGSRESNKDSSSTKGEGPEEKNDFSKEEIESLNEESRKDFPTSVKDSDDFKDSREPDEDSSPSKDEELAEKTHSSKEEIETLSEGSKNDSSTPEKNSDDFRGSKEPDKDSSRAKDEELAKKTHSSTEEIVDVLHRFHVDDKNSNLPFLIGTEVEVSVFPKLEVEVENLEPFDDSFKLKGPFEEDITILGWTTRTLDIGLTREFTWKFAVTDICKPIIGNDFIRHYGFAIENQSLIDPETKLVTSPPSGPCDCGKFSDGWPSSSVLIKKSIPTPYKFTTEIENVENLEKESNTCNTTDNNKVEKELVSCEMKHLIHVIDKNSQTLFFVSKTAQVSLFPRSLIQSRSMEVSVDSETIDCIRLILPIYGWITLKVDFGLEREFNWKFAVVDTIWPVIGIDFLKNFGLQIDYSMKYPRLLDPKTNLRTSEFTGSCDCKFSFNFPIFTALTKLDSDLERFPVQEKLEIINSNSCLNSQCLRKNRMIVVEKETNMPYLICKSAVSIFPKSRVTDEEIEPFEDSFDIVNVFGSVVPIYGWITRKLDFGLGRYFIWKFPVLNICAPIIANDFLNHYGLTFLESWSIFDCVTAKTIMSSDGWCECQGFNWPDPPDMKKRPKVKISKPSSDLLEMNESSEESNTH